MGRNPIFKMVQPTIVLLNYFRRGICISATKIKHKNRTTCKHHNTITAKITVT